MQDELTPASWLLWGPYLLAPPMSTWRVPRGNALPRVHSNCLAENYLAWKPGFLLPGTEPRPVLRGPLWES